MSKVNGWRKLYHENITQKKAEVTINIRLSRQQNKDYY